MMRLLILGTSHVGALRRADERFRIAHPGIVTSYFAGQARMIRTGKLDDNGVFHANAGNEREREILRQINGSTSVGLERFDHVVVASHRPTPLALVSVLGKYRLLKEGDIGLGTQALLSQSFLEAWLTREIQPTVAALHSQFGQRPNFTFLTGPYPAASIVERRGELRLAELMEQFLADPMSEDIFRLWQSVTVQCFAKTGLTCLHQPDETLSGPFATDPKYAQGATDANGETTVGTDHRHMNEEFGFLVLDHLARTRLNVTPKVA